MNGIAVTYTAGGSASAKQPTPRQQRLLATARGETPEETAARKALALDREFCFRLACHGKPAAIPDMFGGMAPPPTWAIDAGGRCVLAGHVVADVNHRLTLTESGREMAAVGERENVEFTEREMAAGRMPFRQQYGPRG